MKSDKILVPGLFPVQSQKTENGYSATIWNRTYTIGKEPMFSSIVSGGEELLAAPMRFVCECNGKPLEVKNMVNLKMENVSEKYQTYAQTTDIGHFLLATGITVFYDGCVKANVKLTPKTGQRWGSYDYQWSKENLEFNKLWLEIPLKKDIAKLYHVYPQWQGFIKDDVYINDRLAYGVNNAGFLPEKNLGFPFKQSVFLGNDDMGLSVFFESDKGWNLKDEDRAIEILVQEDCILLRVHFLDNEHEDWVEKDEWHGHLRHPIVFGFGMQATPVKPFPKNPYTEKSYHDIGIRYDREGNSEYTFLTPLGTEDKTPFIERLKDAGANLVYVHEAWNDFQNGFELTEASVERLKFIIKMGHDNGLKIVPYMSRELASCSPELDENFLVHRLLAPEIYHDDSRFTRYPMQADIGTCYGSPTWRRKFLNLATRLVDEFGADGVYLDGTYCTWPCSNYLHGCGYKDKKGKIHTTYPIWTFREMAEELFEIMESRGKIINAHTCNQFTVPLIAFAHTLMDGEPVQGHLSRSKAFPEGHYRCLYNGRALGLPIFINANDRGEWKYENSLTVLMLLGGLPKAQIDKSLRYLKKVWTAYDSIPMENAEFKPYYKNEVKSTSDVVKTSYFEYDGGVLAIIANTKKEPSGKVDVTFPMSINNGVDQMTGDSVEIKNGNTVTVEFDDLIFKLIHFKK